MQEGWIGFLRYSLHTNKLPEVFHSLPSSRAAVLEVTRPSPPATNIINVESMVSGMSNTDVTVAKVLLASSHSPHMSTAVPVRKSGNSGQIARLSGKRCQISETATATSVVKEEDELDASNAAE